MTDRPDETGFSNARDDMNRAPKPLGYDDLPLDDDEVPDVSVPRAGVPGMMIAAGVIWVVGGGAYVALFLLCRLLQMPLESYDFWLLVGAFFFIKDGVQLILGKFRDPQLDGIISVLLGLFFLWQAFGRGHFLAIAFNVFLCIIFLVPGILVLVGRKQYELWKMRKQLMERDW